MATITATMVKDLREKTGAGMMDCKAALAETKGDIEAAVDWLRTKGLAKAAKKAGRVAAEGLDRARRRRQAGGAGRGQFRDGFRRPQRRPSRSMASGIAEAALQAKGDLDKLCQGQVSGRQRHRCRHHQGDGRLDRREHDASPHRVSRRQERRGRQLHAQRDRAGPRQDRRHRRARVDGRPGGRSKPSAGRSPCISLSPIRKASMSTAWTRPLIERERAVLTEQAKESGKPPQVIEKMVEGRLRKFYEEVVLLAQPFVHDSEHHRGQGHGSRRQDGRRADQDHRFPPVCLGRGDRPRRKPISRREVAAAASQS